jgi:hypothetical protein
MEVPTIQMARQKALDKLESYRHQLTKRADEEYEAAVTGYKALADGKVLLDLVDVFAAVPTDHKDRPALAIARADREQVEFCWSRSQPLFIFDARKNGYGKDDSTLVVRVQAGRLRDTRKAPETWQSRGYALVPMVPADVRPRVDLKKCHVLWEVPEWADNRISAAPSDPYLVQHLAGTLWVVLAEWELTPLEQAITRGRIDS